MFPFTVFLTFLASHFPYMGIGSTFRFAVHILWALESPASNFQFQDIYTSLFTLLFARFWFYKNHSHLSFHLVFSFSFFSRIKHNAIFFPQCTRSPNSFTDITALTSGIKLRRNNMWIQISAGEAIPPCLPMWITCYFCIRQSSV